MSNREVGSLDRFITTRAPALAGWVDLRRRIRAMGFVSGAYGVIGIGSLIGALAAGGGPLRWRSSGRVFYFCPAACSLPACAPG